MNDPLDMADLLWETIEYENEQTYEEYREDCISFSACVLLGIPFGLSSYDKENDERQRKGDKNL